MFWLVYKTTCLVNNKIYIGVHKQEDPNVFDGYYGNSIHYPYYLYRVKHPVFPFHFAFKKYGKENFIRETIAIFDNEEDAFKLEGILVNAEFIHRDDNYNVALGGNRSRATKGYIYVFDTTGKFIQQFSCRKEASDALKINVRDISCSAIRKVARRGYIFSYNRDINISDYKVAPMYKHYFLYNEFGDFVREVNTYKELKLFLSNKGSIHDLSRSIKYGYSCCGYFISLEHVEKFNIIHPIRNK